MMTETSGSMSSSAAGQGQPPKEPLETGQSTPETEEGTNEQTGKAPPNKPPAPPASRPGAAEAQRKAALAAAAASSKNPEIPPVSDEPVKPTKLPDRYLGERVFFVPPNADFDTTIPLPAQIAALNADGTVNLSVLEPDGNYMARTNIAVLSRGQDFPATAFVVLTDHVPELDHESGAAKR